MIDARSASKTRHHRTQLQRPEMVRIAGVITSAVAALAAGILIGDLDNNALAGVLRLAAAVAIILLGVWLLVLRVVRRLRHIEAQLSDRIDAEHELYIRAYMDGLGGRGK